jgi:hypothetical protein
MLASRAALRSMWLGALLNRPASSSSIRTEAAPASGSVSDTQIQARWESFASKGEEAAIYTKRTQSKRPAAGSLIFTGYCRLRRHNAPSIVEDQCRDRLRRRQRPDAALSRLALRAGRGARRTRRRRTGRRYPGRSGNFRSSHSKNRSSALVSAATAWSYSP